ncbi:hypothetical protein [Pseudarthrobacter sp. lyk4-40-TYG-27]|uniref:hypothetical protein n=1 Tax=Pseudarthrobacter sp. lyk4-40-TYG-27 TaxID=3040305 RepID=UPI00255276B8|nr:hypothetical protein [Pseudarthrobacter sp. lyk4-40-TYG-27]
MGVISGTALSMMLTVGGVAMAAEGGPGAGQHYVAGHVLLGMGIGLFLTTWIRTAVRHILARSTFGSRRTPAAQEPADPATVTVLPLRAPSVVPLRGRHAA